MKLTKETVKLSKERFLTIEELVYIYTLGMGEDWELNLSEGQKSKLDAMGLTKSGVLTEEGNILYALMGDEKEIRMEYNKNFEIFWRAYPSSDAFGVWPETKKIRRYTLKKECYVLYLEALKEASHEEMMLGLSNYIDNLKRNSIKENKLRYMVSPLRYLKEKY